MLAIRKMVRMTSKEDRTNDVAPRSLVQGENNAACSTTTMTSVARSTFAVIVYASVVTGPNA